MSLRYAEHGRRLFPRWAGPRLRLIHARRAAQDDIDRFGPTDPETRRVADILEELAWRAGR